MCDTGGGPPWASVVIAKERWPDCVPPGNGKSRCERGGIVVGE